MLFKSCYDSTHLIVAGESQIQLNIKIYTYELKYTFTEWKKKKNSDLNDDEYA